MCSEPIETLLDDTSRICVQNYLYAIGIDMMVLLREVTPGSLAVVYSSNFEMPMANWMLSAKSLEESHFVEDIPNSGISTCLPTFLLQYRSMLSVRIQSYGEQSYILVVLRSRVGNFSSAECAAVLWISRMFAKSLLSLANTQRKSGHLLPPSNAVAAGLINASKRLFTWQSCLSEVSRQLLSSRSEDLDTVINQSLGEIGALTGTERACLFMLRQGDRMEITHEWVAPSLVPMIERLKDVPLRLIDDMRPEFESGRLVYIEDVEAVDLAYSALPFLHMKELRSFVAAPLRRADTLIGFVLFGSTSRVELYEPGQALILQSLSQLLAAAISLREAEDMALRTRTSLTVEHDNLRATLLAIPDLFFDMDHEGRVVAYHEGASAKLAIPPEVFLNRLPHEFLPPELADSVISAMNAAKAGEHVPLLEYKLSSNGETRWYSALVGVKRAGDVVHGFVSLVRDTTERQESARKMRQLSEIAALTSNYVVISDPEGRIEWVNPAFEKRTGWRLDEVRGRKGWEVLAAPSADPLTLARLLNARKSGSPAQGELLQRSRTGEEYWVSLDFLPLYDTSGNVEGFVSVQTDITHLKRDFERELLLRATAIEASTDAITISSPAGYFIYMNPAHRRMFGIPADVPAEKFSWEDLLPTDAKTIVRQDVRAALIADRTWRGEIQGQHCNGSLLDLEVTLAFTDGGEVVSIGRDVTLRKRHEAERAKRREELVDAQKREALAAVASGIAHDLNNLVAVISGTVDMMRSQRNLDAASITNLRRINRAVDAAHDLVGRLGHLERIEAPRHAHDLRTIALAAIDLLGAERISAHAIHADLPSFGCPVFVNHTEVLQVIVNLMLNACEAGKASSNKVKLLIVADGSDLPARKPDIGALSEGLIYIFLAVVDTGDGVPDSLRPRLFERYMTTKGAAGTGLGLPIAASIIREYDGALWFDSEEGVGTTVTIAIPRISSTQPPSAVPTRSNALFADLAGHNILVVDDIQDVGEVISMMLDAEGAIAVAVSDPVEAYELIISEPGLWSAVVTDFDMPGMNGAQLAHAVRQVVPKLPCILVTALPETSGWDPELFDSVHRKPLNRKAFLHSVRRAIVHR
jgi:PAS domain S-box-containing protein